jgi:hypothetical protein
MASRVDANAGSSREPRVESQAESGPGEILPAGHVRWTT